MIAKFPSLFDITLVYSMLRERDRRFFPEVSYRRLLTTIEETDPVHHEIGEADKRWADGLEGRADPVGLRVAFVPDDQREHVDGFGGERRRDIVFETSLPSLIDAGLASQDAGTFQVTFACQAGDRFLFSGSDYEVLEVRPGRYYGNTDVLLTVHFHTTRYRQPSSRFSP